MYRSRYKPRPSRTLTRQSVSCNIINGIYCRAKGSQANGNFNLAALTSQKDEPSKCQINHDYQILNIETTMRHVAIVTVRCAINT